MLPKILKALGKLIVFALVIILLDIKCVFRTITGVPCMGCGTTRACMAFLHLDFAQAFYYHPLFLLSGLIIVILVFNPKILNSVNKTKTIIYALMVALYIGVYITRMVLYFPHTVPMDYNTNSVFYFIFSHIKEYVFLN